MSLILHGQKRLYTSSSIGIFDAFVAKMQKVPIEIFSNKPESDPKDALRNIANDQGVKPGDVKFDMVMHRRHSYNIENTMPFFSKHNTLMFVGSCGGYEEVKRLLKIFSNAHIISTKETGSMYVNDPLLRPINEFIRERGHVDWNQMQDS